jgi:formate dehydrogenase (coenzyme F420) alpha subunit
MKPAVSETAFGSPKVYRHTISRTVCGICSGTCGLTLRLENGQLRSIEGDRNHPVSKGHLCPKGRAITELLKAHDRLRYPLKKTASGGWEPISWNQAFEILSARLRKIADADGPEALAVHVGQIGVGKEFPGYAERFCNLYGTPNFSTCGSHCFESKWMAAVATYGAMPIADYENSRCIVLWGKNPLSSTPSLVQPIIEAQGKGCSLLVVDPRKTSLARQARVHLQPRPGTDGALALGMIHVIIKEELYDKPFVESWTIGFDGLSSSVAEYTPEKVEEITWVPAAQIRQAARLYALTRPACISMGVALELSTNGFQALRAVAVLQAITGNLDVTGGALFLKEAKLTDLRVINGHGRRPAIGAKAHPLFHDSSGHAQANHYAEAILKENPYPLKGLIVSGSNPVLTWPNADKVRLAFKKLDFLAVMDPFMTETARLAHLVIPSASFLGENDLWDTSHLSPEPRLGLAPEVWDEDGLPTNWELWRELSVRMGYEAFFPWKSEEEAINFRLGSLNLTLDDLKKNSDGHIYHRWVGKKYEQDGFKTPSGKVEIYSPELARCGYDPLPSYCEPAESPLSTPHLAARYPLVLTTGARTLGYLHSRFRNIPSLWDRAPEPLLEINPKTAAEFHINDGEAVLLETRRGGIEIRVKITPHILPQVIAIPHGWNQANANLLTDDIEMDPVTGFPAARALLARIVKKRMAPNIGA